MDDASPSPVVEAESRDPAPAPSAPNPLTGPLEPPVRWIELLSLLAIVCVADTTIYRGHGYAGWAALLAVTPALLFAGAARRQSGWCVALLGGLFVLVAARLVWCGSIVAVVVGMALLPLLALSLAGRRPYILDAISFAASLVAYGGRGLASYGRSGLNWGRRFAPSSAIPIVLPLAIGVAFSLLFVLANPDVVKSVSETLSHALEQMRGRLSQISVGETLFLLAVAWIAVGLLRPALAPLRERADAGVAAEPDVELLDRAPEPLYLAWRNTLFVVVLIYAGYLVFEFHTLWFRVFPPGFYYSGYAHEGAAWLTIGLALATSILSLMFRGRMLRDRRVGRLRALASIWSAENLLLAAAVYNRLWIYVQFNGLTNMRIVGVYGVSAVVVGFLLVLVKIVRGHDFAWLLQRHLWTLAGAVYLYAITPVDLLTTRYNVARILSGDAAPSVQLTEHDLSTEGLLAVEPLLESPNVILREGVAALIDRRHGVLEAEQASGPHWTAYQLADEQFLARCRTGPMGAIHFDNEAGRRAAWDRLRAYAWQWY